jgi:predicted DNA-binding protein
MVKVLFNMEPEQHEALKQESEVTGVPVAELIRRAIKGYLAEVEDGK